MRAQDEHPAGTRDAEPEGIGTEREFMDALRALRLRSGLSYRDIVLRMSRAAPRHAMGKSTLAALFAADTLPRRPGQLTAIVDVLTAELAEQGEESARYLRAWTRLMTARSVHPGTPAGSPRPASPAVLPATVLPTTVAAPPWQPAPLYTPPVYRQASVPCTTPADTRSDFEKAGGLWPLLAGGTVLSVLTWLMTGMVGFWWIWLAWCGPVILLTAITAPFHQPRDSGWAELPPEYLRYEQRTTPRWPSPY